ncbi:MAG: hypothetical protein ACTSO9_05830 [Candidatus Helarchaeota archaeon]
MSNRKKIKKIEKESDDIEEELEEELGDEKTEKKEISTARREAIIVEEELEKEMKERMKKREEKEKILYEENRLKRFIRENRENIRIYLFSFIMFLLISIGILSAMGLFAFLGITTQELLLIISGGLAIAGVIILIYISKKYFFPE